MKLAVLIFLSLFPAVALAAPNLSAVATTSGTVTVTGTGFGSAPTILRWDNFEAQTVGAQIKNASSVMGGTYSTTFANSGSDNGLTFSSTYAHSGAKAAKVDWTTANDRSIGFGGDFAPMSSLYISYWRYMNYPSSTLPTTTNHKQWYLFGNQSGPTPQGISFIPAGGQTWGISNNNGAIPSAGTFQYRTGEGAREWADTVNRWDRWEYWVVLNSANTCTMGTDCDGKRYEWIDTQLNFSDDKYQWQNNGGLYTSFWLGYMHGGTSPDVGQAYYDDIYVATSPARVELCDAATWEGKTHCEMQPPSAWSDTGITATLNQGSFAAGSTAYLYVVDASGAVSPASAPITLGPTPSTRSLNGRLSGRIR